MKCEANSYSSQAERIKCNILHMENL